MVLTVMNPIKALDTYLLAAKPEPQDDSVGYMLSHSAPKVSVTTSNLETVYFAIPKFERSFLTNR